VRRRRRPGARTLVAAALAAPVVGYALLRGLALDRVSPLVAAVAFTPYALALGPVAVLGALVLRRRAVAVVAFVASVVLAVCVAPRALDGPAPPPIVDGIPYTVVSANLLFGRADPAAVVSLVRRSRADAVALVELTPAALARLDRAGLAELLPHRVTLLGRPYGNNGSALLSRRPIVPVRGASRPGGNAQPAAVVELPGGRGRVRLQAVHPVPPILPGDVRSWERDLRVLPSAGSDPALSVLLGDFNATLDHRELQALLARGYVDAADAVGAGLRPTWPVMRRRPPITIDHVLVDRRAAVRSYSVHRLPGTDHRALVVRLVLPAV